MSSSETILCYYACASLGALFAYAWDKAAAKRTGARRVRERTLHLWALAGGFVGTLLGQAMFHHKSRRPSFTLIACASAVLHAAGWWWLAR